MKRRAFLAMIGAAGVAPAWPGPVAAPLGVAGGYNRYMYGLAVFHARNRAATSPAALMRLLRLDRGQAEAMLAEMTASGVLSPVTGAVRGARHAGRARPYLRKALRRMHREGAYLAGPETAPRAPLSCAATEGKHPTEQRLDTRSLSMNRFTTLTGIAAPMPLINIDTDMIIPKQFLKTIKRSGLGVNLFDEMRYDDDRREIPDFVLNKPQYREAQIIVAGDNFGCGSSREHAPWAIADFGITCVIAPSFADIFYNNCFKNGILPIALPQEQIDVLMKDAEKGANARMTVDLEAQTVTTSDGEVFSFDVDPFKKRCLMNGLDDIGLTMEKANAIDSYESAARAERPWV